MLNLQQVKTCPRSQTKLVAEFVFFPLIAIKVDSQKSLKISFGSESYKSPWKTVFSKSLLEF
jgi:hypothetical protein